MMRLGQVLVVLSVAGLAACSGAGTTMPGGANGTTLPAAPQSAVQHVSQQARDLFRASLYPAAFRTTGLRQSHLRGWMSPEAKAGKGIIYVGSFDSSTITLYSSKHPNGQPIGQITTGLNEPERLFVDKKLNVYATNAGNNTVTAYAPGTTSPLITISSGISTPTGLSVDSAGTVYVANVDNDTVTEYPAGQTSPSITVSFPSATPENLANGPSNTLYASTFQGIYTVPAGSSTPTNLGLNIGSPGADEVDSQGNIVVLDEDTDNIDFFPAGQTNPTSMEAVGGFPFEIALSKTAKKVYVSNLEGSGFIIQEYNLPKGSAPVTVIPSAGESGWPLAVSPDAVN
jgi:hypothetical protein